MCTVILLRRPDHRWPLLIGANRDEMIARASLPPARHWPDRPGTLAGRDTEAGGTWLGLNDASVVAAIMNRVGSLGPAPDARSRGELPLIALDHATARDGAEAILRLEGTAYRPFNLLVADGHDAIWLARRADSTDIVRRDLGPGPAMLTAREVNDLSSPRIRHYLPRLVAAPTPDPDGADWSGWQALLGHREHGPLEAMTIPETNGFATVSSALLAIPAPGSGRGPHWLFADGPPDLAPFRGIACD